jgi:hypothetical protein
MAHFVETSIGLLNLDQVVWLRAGAQLEEENDYLVELVDGRQIQCKIYHKDFAGRVIPAEPGALAFCFIADGDDDERPTSVSMRKRQIIAWRDNHGYLQPVLQQELLESERAFLYTYDRYDSLEHEGGSFATLDAAKDEVLRQAQCVWDQQHGI